jgi:hypothetical protein
MENWKTIKPLFPDGFTEKGVFHPPRGKTEEILVEAQIEMVTAAVSFLHVLDQSFRHFKKMEEAHGDTNIARGIGPVQKRAAGPGAPG